MVMIMNFLFSKKTYLIIGLLITTIITIIFHNLTFGIAAGFIVGIVKIIKDKILYGCFDWKNMLAIWLGSVLAIVIMYLCIVSTLINFG